MVYTSNTRSVGSSRPRGGLGDMFGFVPDIVADMPAQFASLPAVETLTYEQLVTRAYEVDLYIKENPDNRGTPGARLLLASTLERIKVIGGVVPNMARGMIDITMLPPIILTATATVTDIGHHDFWQEWLGAKRYRFADAVTRLQKDGARVNELEDSWIGLTIHATFVGISLALYFQYLLTKWNVRYVGSPTQYFNSLGNEYDPIKFLGLLLNYKAFGLPLNSSEIDLLSYENTPMWEEGNTVKKLAHYDKYNPTKTGFHYLSTIQKWLLKLGGWIAESGAYDLDWTTISARRKSKYTGFNEVLFNQYKAEVSRFGERCLAAALKDTGMMLTTAKYTDLPTLTAMYQYFIRNYASILLKIEGMVATIQVQDASGRRIGEYLSSFNDPWATKEKIITMPMRDGSGGQVKMTIKDALIAQAEAAYWLIKWNMNKYTGRIAQLEDPTAVLKSEDVTVPFQFDPWRNPFLLVDFAESKTGAGFRNVAQATAKQAEDILYTRRDRKGNIIVTNDFVPIQYLRKADEVARRLTRVQLPGGGYASPDETGAAAKSPAALIAMAAAAAAAIYFTVKG